MYFTFLGKISDVFYVHGNEIISIKFNKNFYQYPSRRIYSKFFRYYTFFISAEYRLQRISFWIESEIFSKVENPGKAEKLYCWYACTKMWIKGTFLRTCELFDEILQGFSEKSRKIWSVKVEEFVCSQKFGALVWYSFECVEVSVFLQIDYSLNIIENLFNNSKALIDYGKMLFENR